MDAPQSQMCSARGPAGSRLSGARLRSLRDEATRRSDRHSGVRLHIEQRPKWTPLGVSRTRWITRSRPDPPVLLLDEIRVAQAFFTTETPFIAAPFMQPFGKSFCEAVGNSLRHDRVIIVVLRPEPIA